MQGQLIAICYPRGKTSSVSVFVASTWSPSRETLEAFPSRRRNTSPLNQATQPGGAGDSENSYRRKLKAVVDENRKWLTYRRTLKIVTRRNWKQLPKKTGIRCRRKSSTKLVDSYTRKLEMVTYRSPLETVIDVNCFFFTDGN